MYTFDDPDADLQPLFLPRRKSLSLASALFNNLAKAAPAGKIDTHTGNRQSYKSHLSVLLMAVGAGYGGNTYELKVNNETAFATGRMILYPRLTLRPTCVCVCECDRAACVCECDRAASVNVKMLTNLILICAFLFKGGKKRNK